MKIDITFKDATPEQINTLLSSVGIIKDPNQLEMLLEDVKPTIETEFVSGAVNLATVIAENPPSIEIDTTEVAGAEGDVAGKFDVDGLPWDERIHSSNKQKTDKGKWRKRRGITDELWDRVVAEIRTKKQNAEAAVSPIPTSLPELPPAPAPEPEQTELPPAPAPTQADAFQNLMNTISSLMSTGTIDPAYVNTIAPRISQAFNVQVASLTDIMQNEQMIQYVFELLRVDGRIE